MGGAARTMIGVAPSPAIAAAIERASKQEPAKRPAPRTMHGAAIPVVQPIEYRELARAIEQARQLAKDTAAAEAEARGMEGDLLEAALAAARAAAAARVLDPREEVPGIAVVVTIEYFAESPTVLEILRLVGDVPEFFLRQGRTGNWLRVSDTVAERLERDLVLLR